MNRKIIIIGLNVALIYFNVYISAFGQNPISSLNEKKISVKMEKQPLGVIFKYLMKNYDLAIGFERSSLDQGSTDFEFETNLSGVGIEKFKSKDDKLQIEIEVEREFEAGKNWITIDAKEQRLEDVFNCIVGQMKYYKWEINNDVINIFPIKGRDPKFKALLELKINNFNFKKGSTIYSITTNIKKIPEFDEFLRKNNLNFTGIRTGPKILLSTQYGKKIDVEMNFTSVTFLDLLNQITKIKRGGWILKNMGVSKHVLNQELIDLDI